MNVPIVLSNLIEFENRTRLFIWIHNYLIYILFFLFDYFIIKHLTQKKTVEQRNKCRYIENKVTLE